MKNIFPIIFLLSVLSFSSCSTDDDSTSTSIVANRQLTGSSANDLLSTANFSSLDIELVYMDGYEPTATAVNNLVQFLEERTFKEEINITSRSIPAFGDTTLNLDQVIALEEQNRTLYNQGNSIAVYVLFTNASNENDSGNLVTLGSAYWNTSIVVYGASIDEISNQTNGPSRSSVETTTLEHEFGHLLGLVNVGTELQSPHEDANNNAHCETDDCLMRASAAFGSGLINMLGNDGVPDLCSHCIADLQANGGK